MKEFFKKIGAWLEAWRMKRAGKRYERREKELKREAQRNVQLMEFCGDVFISVDGMPVIPEVIIKGYTMPDVLNLVRDAYVAWHKRNGAFRS